MRETFQKRRLLSRGMWMPGMWMPVMLAGLLLAGMPGCGDDDGADVDILECEGSCECDEDTRTCSCLGGTECVVEGEEDITLVCEGNARCDLQCEALCTVECPGTAGCTFVNASRNEDLNIRAMVLR